MKYTQLRPEDRQRICVLKTNKLSVTQIAVDLNRHPSTIRRELNRNGYSGYDDRKAQKEAHNRRFSSRNPYKWNLEFRDYSTKQLQLKWSPEQICAGWKKQTGETIHPRTVYRFINADKANGGKLYEHLRHGKKRRRKVKRAKSAANCIKNKVSISERPAEVARCERIGDLELDTFVGPQNRGAIAAITDRRSNYLWLIQVHDRTAWNLSEQVKRYLKGEIGRIKTITSDNGREFAEHERIAKSLKISFYFADPYQTNQRSRVEHAIKLVRQYIPKGTDLQFITQRELNKIAAEINSRIRKKLGFKTPKEIYYQPIN